MVRLALSSSLAVMAVASVASVAAAQTWETLALPSGGRATRYLPSGVRACEPSPLVLFLHGAGGTPEAYHSHLAPHAEALGAVLVLPQASGAGWSGADVTTLNEALAAVEDELTVDERRVYFAGHSAGGAFAYILTYDGSEGIAAVFSMSAPFYAVDSLSDPAHTAPIRMYYGADDPNYTGGSADALAAQWTSLGVPHETDVQDGFGHSTWPPSSIRAGLEFLLAVRYPGAPTPSTCPGADAGVPAEDAGAADEDAGTLPGDAGVAPPEDAGVPDAGPTRRGPVDGGCGCRAAGAPAGRVGEGATPPGLLAWIVLLLGIRRRAGVRRTLGGRLPGRRRV